MLFSKIFLFFLTYVLVISGFSKLIAHSQSYLNLLSFLDCWNLKKYRINIKVNFQDSDVVGLSTTYKPTLTQSVMKISFE